MQTEGELRPSSSSSPADYWQTWLEFIAQSWPGDIDASTGAPHAVRSMEKPGGIQNFYRVYNSPVRGRPVDVAPRAPPDRWELARLASDFGTSWPRGAWNDARFWRRAHDPGYGSSPIWFASTAAPSRLRLMIDAINEMGLRSLPEWACTGCGFATLLPQRTQWVVESGDEAEAS